MGIKYLFLGCCISDKDDAHLFNNYCKKGNTVSNLSYERKILNYIISQKEIDALFISCPIVGLWPINSKKPIVKGFRNEEKLKICKYNCTYGLSHFSKYKSIIKEIRHICASLKESDSIHIVAFEAHSPYLKAIKYCKSIFKNTFSTLVVPDLPIDMVRKSSNPLYYWLKKRDIKKIYDICDLYVDSFICFTEKINHNINNLNKPFFISNGIISQISIDKKTNNIKKCVFLGKTDKRNGVELIAEAAKTNKNPFLEFHVYGSGELDEFLAKSAKEIDNFYYHGFVLPSNVSNILKTADIFLSPRLPTNEEYLSNSFPSKILEYIPYCQPIITFKLPCYGDLYDDVFTYIKNASGEALLDAVNKVDKNTNAVSREKIINNLSVHAWFKKLMSLRIK